MDLPARWMPANPFSGPTVPILQRRKPKSGAGGKVASRGQPGRHWLRLGDDPRLFMPKPEPFLGSPLGR